MGFITLESQKRMLKKFKTTSSLDEKTFKLYLSKYHRAINPNHNSLRQESFNSAYQKVLNVFLDDMINESEEDRLNNAIVKTKAWFLTANPLLGFITPMNLFIIKDPERLLRFINNLVEGNIA